MNIMATPKNPRGVQGQNSWEHDFEITGDPKVPPMGQRFGGSLRPQTHISTCGAMPLFRAKISKMANKAQNRDVLTLIDNTNR